MLTYNMDVEDRSTWLRATPGPLALEQPFFVTEAGQFWGRGGFRTAREHKESYLLFYTVAGTGVVRQRNQELRLLPGTALLLDCRAPQSYGTWEGDTHWRHFWLHCDGSGVRAMAPVLNPEGVLRAVALPPAARGDFERVLQLLPRDNVESVLDMSLAVHSILTAMAAAYYLDPDTSEALSNKERMDRTAAYVRAHAAEDLSLEQLVARTHLSRSYFLKLFKQYIGATPYNYLVRCRITKAKELLEMTELPVREIAIRVGFHDESNFSTRFTKMVGETPKHYRANAITKSTAV